MRPQVCEALAPAGSCSGVRGDASPGGGRRNWRAGDDKWPRMHLRQPFKCSGIKLLRPDWSIQVSPATNMDAESDDEPQGNTRAVCTGCGDVYDPLEVGARLEHSRDPPPNHDLVPRALSGKPSARLPEHAWIGGNSVHEVVMTGGVRCAGGVTDGCR